MTQLMTETARLAPMGKLVRMTPNLSVRSLSPFKIANNLRDHPLFTDQRIKRLLRTLPRKHVEIRDVQPLGLADGSYKRGRMLDDADPVDTFERLAEKPSWMLLHETWIHDADFSQLVKDYVRELQEGIPDIGPEVSDLGCWIFLSSGRCVVHFHADPDQSFLNQVRGSKTVYVYPAAVLPQEQIEKLVYTHNQGVVPYDPGYEPRMYEPVHLDPGETVFLPLYAPHRVTNDDGVSVSINFGFHTRCSKREIPVHLVNLELRRLGFSPRPVNQSPMVDSLKRTMHLAVRVRNKLFKSLKPKVTV